MCKDLQISCPWCGGALERGTFRSRGRNFFLPEGETCPHLYSAAALRRKRAILLPPDALSLSFPAEYPIAYVCRACKRIVLPYSEDIAR